MKKLTLSADGIHIIKELTLSVDGICIIVKMLDESIKAAEESLTSERTDLFKLHIFNKATDTDLIKYENYKYNIGRCHALLDVLQAVDMDLFSEHFNRYSERIEEFEEEANGRIYNKLRNAMEKFELEG